MLTCDAIFVTKRAQHLGSMLDEHNDKRCHIEVIDFVSVILKVRNDSNETISVCTLSTSIATTHIHIHTPVLLLVEGLELHRVLAVLLPVSARVRPVDIGSCSISAEHLRTLKKLIGNPCQNIHVHTYISTYIVHAYIHSYIVRSDIRIDIHTYIR